MDPQSLSRHATAVFAVALTIAGLVGMLVGGAVAALFLL